VKKFLAVLPFAALSSATAFAGEMTGYISDLKCASSNSKAASASKWIVPAAFESCAQKCVKEGSPAVFVTEDNKILKFDAESMKKITPHVGHKVNLTGTVDGGMLKVESITSISM
jgi:hypothetical protein